MFLISPGHELLKVSYCDRSSVRTYVRLNISFETTWPNSMKLHRKLPWVSLQKYNKGSWLINNNNNNKMADFLFYFKKHLWNYMAKFNETLQEASLGDPLQKYNSGSRLINNNSNKMADFLFCFKNISYETTIPNSRKLYRNLPWVTLYKNTTRGHDWSTTTKWPTSCFL